MCDERNTPVDGCGARVAAGGAHDGEHAVLGFFLARDEELKEVAQKLRVEEGVEREEDRRGNKEMNW